MRNHFVSAATFRKVRERCGLTQAQASRALGVDPRTLQRWEGGEVKRVRRVYLDTLRAQYLTGQRA